MPTPHFLDLNNKVDQVAHVYFLWRVYFFKYLFVYDVVVPVLILLNKAFLLQLVFVAVNYWQVVVVHYCLEGWQRNKSVCPKQNISFLAFFSQHINQTTSASLDFGLQSV